ncbi:MAG TPA: dUTP diphosphatase, partial [Myxococcales bacterium]|nr:dUTP diphosphatase [Myxococcales bacterium]
LPAYQTAGAAGADLRSDVDVTLAPGQRVPVPTGLAIEIPEGYEGQVRARSGLALRSGIGLPNGPGTIDSDYRGELAVLLINWSAEPVPIHRGDRIAQLVIAPVVRAEFALADELSESHRGEGGFGHTGHR